MTIESMGPGGVNRSSGPRTTSPVSSSPRITSLSLDADGSAIGLVGPDGNYPIRPPYRPTTRKSRVLASANNGIGVAGGWSKANGGGNSTIDTENTRVPGRPVLRHSGGPTGSAVYSSIRMKVPATLIYGAFEVWYYIPNYTAGNLNLVLTYSSDTPAQDPPTSTPSNNRTFTVSAGVQQPGRWNCIRIDADATAAQSPTNSTWVNTGTPNNNEIEYLELILNCSSLVPDGERYLLYDVVAIGGGSTPVIMLGNDGNYTSTLSVAVPYLREYGMRAYHAMNSNDLESTRSFIDQIYDAGWDIITQGLGHLDYGLNPKQLKVDLPIALQLLANAGYERGAKFFAYPYNSANYETGQTLLENGIVCAREANNSQLVVSSLGRQQLISCGSYDLGQKTAADMQAAVETAKLHGTSLWTYWHDLVTTASVSTETTIAEWKAFIQYLAAEQAAGRVIIATPSEFVEITNHLA